MPKVKNIFAPKSSRVLRVLLVNSRRDWTEREIAQEATVSSGLAHYVSRTLIELGIVVRDERNKLLLADPLRLLKRWAAYHQYDRMNEFLDYFTFEREIDQFMKSVAQLDLDYATSGLAGAWLVAPYVRPVNVHLYVSDKDVAKEINEKLKLNPIPRGGNVKFVLPYDEGVFYGTHEVRGVKVVSNVQLYVDLYNFPARGEEASSALLELILREWQEKRRGNQSV